MAVAGGNVRTKKKRKEKRTSTKKEKNGSWNFYTAAYWSILHVAKWKLKYNP